MAAPGGFVRFVGRIVLPLVLLACVCTDASAACTAEQIRQLQEQNVPAREVANLCADDARKAAAASERSAAAVRTTDRCYTWVTNCILFDRQRVGSSCWCITPFGPAYGSAK